jgi:uncharacterized protein involved in exopolysaccharide biosynthesis
MFENSSRTTLSEDKQPPTFRDFLAIGFRRRRLIVAVFCGIFGLAIVTALLLPKQYQSEMKILVKNHRADAMVTPDRDTPMQLRTEVSEEELQSEAELLKSRDLLTDVVISCDLKKSGNGAWWRPKKNNDEEVSAAVVKLEKDLKIEPIKLTNLISVSYRSKDPQLAAKVLNSLADLYIQKHLAINHVPGALDFFHQQAEEYRKLLTNAEAKLTSFSRSEGVVNPSLQKEMTVRKLVEFEAEAKDARTTISETRRRIGSLEAQLAAIPQRQTTQVRTADNPQLMEKLKSTMLDLELKRIDLLTKFTPNYRPVQEVEAQIDDTKNAITEAVSAPLKDETTDQDPAFEALRVELAKSKAQLAGAEARAAATAGIVGAYQKESQQLDDKEVLHQDILRTAKAAEENYMLYSRKQEEARISDALDRERISNVVVAVPANVPVTARSRWAIVVLLGGILAGFLSVMLAFLVDYWDPSFRTPEEVESFMGSPVVAAFPRSGD